MPGAVILLTNPFRPQDGRQILAVPEPLSVRAWLDGRGIREFPRPTLCLMNGRALLRRDWPDTLIADGDVVTFVPLPLGGGGGGGGKNPLRTVLMIAVMIAGLAAGGIATALGAGSLVSGLIGAGVSLAGAALINVLVPPPRPSLPAASFGAPGSSPGASPTYTLQAQGNQARLSQPIPVVYGRHLIYPDLAAAPYTEFADNEQILHQLHCIGQGDYEIEQIRIEDTPIASFEEIAYEIVPPGGTVTLFDADVATAPEVAGQELLAEADGGGWVGPFAANPAGTTAGAIGIDVILPRGLCFAASSGALTPLTVTWEVAARAIDDDGAPAGDWILLATETFTAATVTAQRRSYRYALGPARYQVRLRRFDVKDTDARAGHELRWQDLRTHLTGSPAFGDVTLLALKMRATDNLSQRSSRLVNVIVTRKLPVWNAETGWSPPLATRSIAWAFADACRASYGGKLADTRIDLPALAALDAEWAARGDAFDAVFDQGVTVWEALTRIARAGRAVPFLQGGIVRIARDGPRTLPVALFGPRNIVKGSFRVEYLMPGEDTADAVTVEYFSARTWKPDEVTASLPDSTAEQPAKVQLFGCTSEAQARREGLYMAAANRYRRRLITFATELEGLIPTYGDLVAIAHDLPRWGQGAEAVAWDAVTNTLTLSEPMEWTESAGHWIALRRRDGGVSGPWAVTPGPAPDQVVLTATPEIEPFIGASEERTHVAFGAGQAWSLRARVLGVRPRGEQVEITCVGEAEEVHSADQTG